MAVWFGLQSKYVSVLELTDQGNLALLDGNNVTVWQSFDHPTDSIVRGQRLVSGQMLKSSMSDETWREGSYSFSIDDDGYLVASYVEADATRGSFMLKSVNNILVLAFIAGSGISFICLGYDGHLKSFWWVESNWIEVIDMFESQIGQCGYPEVCGKYGICSEGGRSCPDGFGPTNYSNWFGSTNSSQRNLGCSPNIPVSCDSLHQHSLLKLEHTDDYSMTYIFPFIPNIRV